LFEDLFDLVNGLQLPAVKTEWGNYYAATNYDEKSLQHKKQILGQFVFKKELNLVWDLGGNTGYFSRVFSDKGINTVCFDIDPVAVERNYLQVKENKDALLLPLLFDITNPSPGIGWAGKERVAISERGKPDLIMTLALIHHLFITHHCSFEMLSNYLAANTDLVILEFVPVQDSQVQRLINNRQDNLVGYSPEHFEQVFCANWHIAQKIDILDTHRTIYLLEKK